MAEPIIAADSSVRGYLLPEPPPAHTPLNGQLLEDFLHDVVCSLCNLAGEWVRPRWQPEPPNLPDKSQAWIALGIVGRQRDFNAYVGHDGSGEGADNLKRWETLDILLSFYGPDGDALCAQFDDGLQVDQNRAMLRQNGMGIVGLGDPLTVPSLTKDTWLYRTDLHIQIRREVLRTYPVLNILSSGGAIITKEVTVDFEVSP